MSHLEHCKIYSSQLQSFKKKISSSLRVLLHQLGWRSNHLKHGSAWQQKKINNNRCNFQPQGIRAPPWGPEIRKHNQDYFTFSVTKMLVFNFQPQGIGNPIDRPEMRKKMRILSHVMSVRFPSSSLRVFDLNPRDLISEQHLGLLHSVCGRCWLLFSSLRALLLLIGHLVSEEKSIVCVRKFSLF